MASDVTSPTAAITYTPSGPYKSGDTITITATFSESINTSPIPQISISGSNVVSTTNMARTSDVTYTYSHTISAGDGIATISMSTAQDLAGNIVISNPTSGADFTVDNTVPQIIINGPVNIIIEQNSTYTDAGATATDNLDGDITILISTINPVDTSIAGTYTITYDVNDSAGNTATQVIRTVTVQQTITNTTPVANDDIMSQQATQGIPLTINTITLLSNDLDADGDTITVQSVDNTSANFGIVSLSDNTITYTSSNSFTGDDIFSYTITDGTDTDSAIVTVTVIEQPTFDGIFVYVIDNYSKEMTKFDDTGNYLSTITGFIGPFDVDADESGNIYASATNWHRVQKYDTNNNLILTIQGIGTTESLNDLSSLYAPHGTAVDDNTGDIYSVTWAGFVQKFDGAGNYITHWGEKGSNDGQFNQPNGIATDSDGNVYVADRLNHRIQKFDGVGNHLLSFGELGRENGQFDWPSKVSVDDTNNVYVADSYNSRIQKFDVMGNHLLTIKMPDSDSMDWVADVDTDSEGNIYAIDQRHYRIVKFDSVGNFVTSWAYGPFDRIIGIAVVG